MKSRSGDAQILDCLPFRLPFYVTLPWARVYSF